MVSERECIDALREAAATLGHSPTKAEYEDIGRTPASATIIRTIGGWNDAKARAGLSTNASTGSRVGPPPAGVDDEIREHWAELSVDQRWHYRNREWNTDRTLDRRAELQEWLDERSAEAGCKQCGESDPRCLDFHHRDSGKKSDGLSEMVTRGASMQRLQAEMEKCEVLCANCHRTHHTDEYSPLPTVELRRQRLRLVERESGGRQSLSSRQKRRTWVRNYKARRGCSECSYRTAAALDLHHIHPRTKTESVGRLISDGCTVQRLLREIHHCEILCANCHRKLHAADSGDGFWPA